MSPVPRKRNTINLTEVIEDPSSLAHAPILHAPNAGESSRVTAISGHFSPQSVAGSVRRNRLIVCAVLLAVAGLSFAFGRDDAESTSATAPSTLELLSTENERLRARVAELEAALTRQDETPAEEVQAAMSAESETAPITRRTYVPDGSDRDDPFFGPKDSPVIAMIFSDYQCKLCREFHLATIPKIRSEYAEQKRLKLIFRDFPLASDDHARREAAFAHCAGEQGAYWAAFDLLNTNEKAVTSGDVSRLLPKLSSLDTAALAQCLRGKKYDSEIKRDEAQAQALGARGAPSTFIGVRNAAGSYDGVFIRGAQPYPVVKQEIERALARLGTP